MGILDLVMPKRKTVVENQERKRYPPGAPCPTLPTAQIVLQIALVAIGLLALGIAAYRAFSLVMPVFQAGVAALLIESGMIVETWAMIRRNRYAAIGAAISVVVSVSYNYTQVASAADKLDPALSSFQLYALALGPLSAVLFAALAVGFEFARQERNLAAWKADQAYWQAEKLRKDKEQEAAQAAEDRAARERQRHDELEADLARRQQEFEQALLRERQAAELQTQRDLAMAQEASRVELARIRAEARLARPTNDGQASPAPARMTESLPSFSRGLDGFLEYVRWLSDNGQTFADSPEARQAAAQALRKSPRQIERYLHDLSVTTNGNGKHNGGIEA